MKHLGIDIDLTRDGLFDENGLKRLKDSYMTDDETTPQQRFAFVAKQFSSNPEHAQRLYDYASKHWLSFSTPILSFGRSKKGLPISCFAAGTPINEFSNGFKNIEDIAVGDQVLTHKNRYRTVLATKKSSSDDLYEVRVFGRKTTLTVTGNHQFLTNSGWKRIDQIDINSDFLATNGILEEYQETPYTIQLPQIDQVSVGGRFVSKNPTEYVVMDEDLAWAIGLWFAEGSTNKNGMISITMGIHERDVIERWLSIMSSKFDLTKTEVKDTIRSSKWSSGYICNKILTQWFDDTFGKGCKAKICPEWLLNLPKSMIASFYDGFYLGDGYKTTSSKAIALANRNLIGQLYYMLLKLGKANISLNVQSKFNKSVNRLVEVGEIREYSITHLKKRLGFNTGILFDKLYYRHIESIVKVHGRYDVYDIQVDEDESFSAAGVIAHNCFLNYVPDTASGLVDNLSETNWLSMMGGGVGIGMGIRAADDKSTGFMPHAKIYDASSLAYRQGKTRRGSYALYMDISNPEVLQFVEMRKPTGDHNVRCLNLHHGINITDEFMEKIEQAMIDPNFDDTWELKCPKTGEVKDTISAKYLWQLIIQTRIQTGEPYIHFIDASNRAMHPMQKAAGLKIRQSNLCIEIMLATDALRTAVCCLSSVNAAYYDTWKKNKLFLKDVAEMLDNVLQHFIDNAPKEVARAVFSAMSERSIGIGVLGFHTYLQQNNIAFESALAKSFNMKLFKHIRTELDKANQELGAERGSPKDIEGSGDRFTRLMAVAPTASTSIIMGNVSPSIEPYRANAYLQDTLSGSYLTKNVNLDNLLKAKCKKDDKLVYDELWSSIISNDGSVQHLKCLDEYEKEVYKTAIEIDQRWIIEHAADRQEYIDQGQSVNLFFLPTVNIKYLHGVHFMAWKKGMKSLYYCRSEKLKKADKVAQRIERKVIEELTTESLLSEETCLACQ